MLRHRLPGDLLEQAVEFFRFGKFRELADDRQADGRTPIYDGVMTIGREHADLRPGMAEHVGEKFALGTDPRSFAGDDLGAQSQHGLAAGHDGDTRAGDATVELLHVTLNHREVRVVHRAQLLDRLAVAVHRVWPRSSQPDGRVFVGHPVLLQGEAKVSAMLQAELHEILDARIRQESRRHGEELGLARGQHRLGFVLLRRQIPVLDHLRTADGRDRQLLMPLDPRGLGHLRDERGHPDVEAMARRQHLEPLRRRLLGRQPDGREDEQEQTAKEAHRSAYLLERYGPAGSASAPAEYTLTSGKLAQA